jgi:hypothetical protein
MANENAGKNWSNKDLEQLKKLAKGNTPTGLIAMKLGRTETAVQAKASQQNVSLKPTNQSPYDRSVANKKKGK